MYIVYLCWQLATALFTLHRNGRGSIHSHMVNSERYSQNIDSLRYLELELGMLSWLYKVDKSLGPGAVCLAQFRRTVRALSFPALHRWHSDRASRIRCDQAGRPA